MEQLSKEDLRALKLTVASVTEQTIREAMMTTHEVYISRKQLSEQFGMFGKDWMTDYGHLLPRTRWEIDMGGDYKVGNWYYPRNQIAMMIANNEIKHLKFRDKDENQN